MNLNLPVPFALGGTASSGDFTLSGATLDWTSGSATGTVTIPAGSDQATVTIIATDLPANDEVVDFTLVPPPDEDFWSIGDHESAAVTLLGGTTPDITRLTATPLLTR